MNKLIVYILSVLWLFNVSANNKQTEDLDSITRENPLITISDYLIYTSISEIKYTYINTDSNNICYNGADWSKLYSMLNNSQDNINIVHIGDSHIQADIATGHSRNLLQKQFGYAGRGLITPFKLAKTNEPRDYSITSSSQWNFSKALKLPWNNTMGFTGIAISPINLVFDLTISTSSKTSNHPFNHIRLYHEGTINVDSVLLKRNDIDTRIEYSDKFFDVYLSDTILDISLEMSSIESISICGAMVENTNSHGIMYHSIGNNGATFETYNKIALFCQGIAALTPHLIIISLGTNEAFSNMTPSQLYHSIDNLVSSLKKANPQSQLLLTTPMECQQRKWIRRNKRRSRRYVVNNKIEMVRNQIIQYGKDNKIAVYDWYIVAGGSGISNKWYNDKLMNRDRIHNTQAGYVLQGTLLYNAFIKDIKSGLKE